MRLDPTRVLRATALVAWASFYAWLWLSGEMTRYLGPRTYWVVAFGAIGLGACALAHLVTLRSERPRRISVRETGGIALLIVPILAVVVVPRAELGSLAAAKKRTSGIAVGALAAPAPDVAGEPSFINVHFAERSERYSAETGIGEGTELDLLGFVTRPPGTRPQMFELTRFYVSCCAADAIPYGVRVDPDDAALYRSDAWLRVSGVLAKEGRSYVVSAEYVTTVAEPDDPYLY